MKRSPMPRTSKPIRRKTRLKAKRATKRRSGRVRDEAYMAWVRTLPCVLQGGGCLGAIHAHHAGVRAGGRKADDNTTIPFCARHHGAWHDGAFPFLGWIRQRRRDWATKRIAETQAAWHARGVTTAFEELKW